VEKEADADKLSAKRTSPSFFITVYRRVAVADKNKKE
jgi:hypothetical protein